MTLRSVSYTGTWPTGIHWSPGEIREVPETWPGADEPLPAGLEHVDPAPAAPAAPTEDAPS